MICGDFYANVWIFEDSDKSIIPNLSSCKNFIQFISIHHTHSVPCKKKEEVGDIATKQLIPLRAWRVFERTIIELLLNQQAFV